MSQGGLLTVETGADGTMPSYHLERVRATRAVFGKPYDTNRPPPDLTR